MRILHFSDFHLDKTPINISKSQKLLDNMIQSIMPYHKERHIDMIIFTGDMVNMGGKSFDNIQQGFQTFKNLIIVPLVNALNLGKERFIFCPGNHDVDRMQDNKFAESGLTEQLNSSQSLDEFYEDPKSFEVMKRILDFKNFEKQYYGESPNLYYQHSNFQSNFKFNIDDKSIGITSLNTAWRCWDSNTDKGKILMCYRQISDSESYIKDCDIKIALSHHSYTWMNNFEILQLEKYITQDYDMYFCGHTHSSNAEYCIKPEGKTFKLVAPGIMTANNLEKNPQYKNGFSIIDYDLDNAFVETMLFFQNDVLQFIQNKNHGKNGVWHIDIPLGEEQQQRKKIQEVIIGIKEEIEYLNKHLLSYNTDTKAPKTFNEIFVTPKLTIKKSTDKEKSENQEFEEEDISIDDIIKSNDNFIIFGIKESGKTILLDKLLLEVLNKNNGTEMLPAVIQFKDIRDDIESCIRNYWHQKRTSSVQLIEQCKIVLLVDNLDFSDNQRMNSIISFIKRHPNSRLIATCLETQKNDLILDAYSCSDIDYQRVEINEFNSKQIKTLAQNWIVENNNSETKAKKIELLINAFSSIDLPRTPFAVSMFLWILERQQSYRPQNNSILIKQFLESLLQSNETKGAPREQFDYINKSSLLGILAKEMLDEGNQNYSLPSSKVLEIIEKHMEELKFSFYSARKEMNNFLDLGILTEDDKSRITFRFSCFFEYYLFVFMEQNEDFKKYVLSPDVFTKFSNEIIYYTGIHRNEKDILKMIVDTLEYNYIDINEIVFKKIKSVDDFFNVDKSLIENLSANDLIQVLPDKQTEVEKEAESDAKLNRQKGSQKQGIIEKKDSNKFSDYAKLLLLSMNVLKNLEEIKEDGVKKAYYTTILRNSISYMVLFKLICEEMINHSSHYSQQRIEDLKFFLRLLPVLHETLISEHMGTYKLTGVIKEKLYDDYKTDGISEMEIFLSTFLYVDLKGENYTEILNKFIAYFRKAYIADACFFKISSYYYTSNDGRLDSILLNALSDMYIRIHQSKKSNKRLDKGKVMQMLISNKKRNKSDSI